MSITFFTVTLQLARHRYQFYVRVTVHRNKFLCNKTNYMHWLHKFIPAWNSTRFGQFLCPSSGVYSLYSAMVYVIQVCRQLSSRSIFKRLWHIPLLSVQWINSWWWTEELSETCRVSCQNKFVKLVHVVGVFLIKKYTSFSTKWPTHIDVIDSGHLTMSYLAQNTHLIGICTSTSACYFTTFTFSEPRIVIHTSDKGQDENFS
jgi:hypothetical protein